MKWLRLKIIDIIIKRLQERFEGIKFIETNYDQKEQVFYLMVEMDESKYIASVLLYGKTIEDVFNDIKRDWGINVKLSIRTKGENEIE